jgi:hypothetical protein
MISREKALKLTSIYLYICNLHESELQFTCERFSNNSKPEFTDQELITVYLFVMHSEQRFKVKQIYQFAKDYLSSWFPKLPSYVAFNTRLNRLSEAFKFLSMNLLEVNLPADCSSSTYVIDSMPIITCSGKRHAKVAKELTDKTYCATKGFWYYGLKLHVLGSQRPNKLPYPESIVITQASENDLNVFKQYWFDLPNRHFYGDKIYHDEEFFFNMKKRTNSKMLTPVKGVKGQSEQIKFIDKAADDLFSKAVSSIRQPIESLFNRLIEKTDIQRASKVRSTKGLMVHVFGRIAAPHISF